MQVMKDQTVMMEFWLVTGRLNGNPGAKGSRVSTERDKARAKQRDAMGAADSSPVTAKKMATRKVNSAFSVVQPQAKAGIAEIEAEPELNFKQVVLKLQIQLLGLTVVMRWMFLHMEYS